MKNLKCRAWNYILKIMDDDLFMSERQALVENGVLDNWIEVDLRKDPDCLGKFLQSFPIPIQDVER